MGLFKRESMLSITEEIAKAKEADKRRKGFKDNLKYLLKNATDDRKESVNDRMLLVTPFWNKLHYGSLHGDQKIREELMINSDKVLNLSREELDEWLKRYEQYVNSIED